MVATRPRFLPNEQSNQIVRFVLLSLALHAALLYWLKPLRTDSPSQEPLEVTLSARRSAPPRVAPAEPPRVQKSAVAVRLHEQPIVVNSPDSGVKVTIPAPAAPAPTAPAINLDAALSTARSYAHEAQPRTTLDAPKPMLTVEAAIARATEPDVIVESRGANGEHVTTSRHSRCVTAILVPHYMQGMTMPTLCGKRKG
jgi:hypothetical protein